MKSLVQIALIGAVLFLGGCRKTRTFSGTDVAVEFSSDTLYLDTVFTGMGSSTYSFKVFNPSAQNILIDRVYLGRGESSFYRLNVDGVSGRDVEGLEILAGDSTYIFVEITPDVGLSQELIYKDSVWFEVGNKRRHVDLITAVWDAHYHFPNKVLTLVQPEPYPDIKIPYSILDCNTVWSNDKPHVVYGYVVVDSACSMHIDPGTQVHFHSGSGIWVYKDGALEVDGLQLGSIDEPTVFQGDRLEPSYEFVPGQWGGILGGIFIQGGAYTSANLNNLIIKNSTTAIRIDSAWSTSPNVNLHNVVITHNSRIGIYGGYASVQATNTAVGPSGLYGFYGLGGNYVFDHCTFNNTWSFSSRNGTAVALFNWFEDGVGNTFIRDLSATWTNSAIVGNSDNELALGINPSGLFDATFIRSALTLDEQPDAGHYSVSDTALFQQCVFNAALPWKEGPLFPADQWKYVPDSTSALWGMSEPIGITPFLDLHGTGRTTPGTAGAVERP